MHRKIPNANPNGSPNGSPDGNPTSTPRKLMTTYSHNEIVVKG